MGAGWPPPTTSSNCSEQPWRRPWRLPRCGVLPSRLGTQGRDANTRQNPCAFSPSLTASIRSYQLQRSDFPIMGVPTKWFSCCSQRITLEISAQSRLGSSHPKGERYDLLDRLLAKVLMAYIGKLATSCGPENAYCVKTLPHSYVSANSL